MISRFHLHFCYINGKCKVIGADKKKLKYTNDIDQRHFQPVKEKILEKSFLHLNHYALQSRSWFLDVKCQRGAADTQAHDKIRNISYFEKYDQASDEILDDELSKKDS